MSASVRAIVAARAGRCCEYCRSQEAYATQVFSLEHIDPLSRSGTDDLENLAYACQGCNNHKYNHTNATDPQTGQLVPLFHPRRQVWEDHFTWSPDLTEVVGVTPTGRATVAALHLNREGVVNLRRVLAADGLHPPSVGA